MSRAGPAPRAVLAPGGVPSVERALDLLEVLAAGPRGMSEVAAAAGLPDGTAHRLLRTLVARGYVRQGPDRRYALGTRLLGLGDGARQAAVAAAGPFLARLVEVSGETANLAVLEGDHVVYVAQVPSAHRLRMFAEVGRRVSAHSTAVGKVLLAGLPDAEVEALVARTGLAGRTARTLTTSGRLLAELGTVRRQGWAVDDEEEEPGVRCLAVPVVDGSRTVAAMSVSGPTARVPATPAATLVRAMRATASAFAAGLDHTAPQGFTGGRPGQT
ncbi:MAG: IclR family transcriptional regulator, acetate operon repressor [Solirubrobacterales bacterium]|nr:IclR family transcriptional regulator, acetate operon repressor [Solirubrobacterales bacterium]